MVERMDLILPAIGRLLVASRPAAMPAGTLLRLIPAGFQFSLLETDVLNTITEEHRPATVNPSRVLFRDLGIRFQILLPLQDFLIFRLAPLDRNVSARVRPVIERERT